MTSRTDTYEKNEYNSITLRDLDTDTEKIQYSSTGGKVQKTEEKVHLQTSATYMTHHHKDSGFVMRTPN